MTSGTSTATPIWTQIATFPNNSLDEIKDITGDANVIGRWFMSLNGSGHVKLNWLLNRDLDPTSNDNTSAFMNQYGANDNSPMPLDKAA
jgi:hypothetical protein